MTDDSFGFPLNDHLDNMDRHLLMNSLLQFRNAYQQIRSKFVRIQDVSYQIL
jgi:hypothetical protein